MSSDILTMLRHPRMLLAGISHTALARHPRALLAGISCLLLVLLTILEFSLFKSYLTREVTPYYPTNFDQTTFLLISYTFFENIKTYGILYALKHTELLATGVLFPIQATVFYFIFHASRFFALLPNLLWFIALQFTLFFTVKSITQKTHLAFIALGLVLCLHTPFITYGGGISDFRMDFIAFCLYGIVVSFIMQSNVFLQRRFSLVAAIFASLLVLFRTITAVYIITLAATLFIWFIKKRDYKRLKNISLAGLVVICLILPYLWLNKETLYGYYVFNHMIGYDKVIRAVETGTTTFLSSLVFYPESLIKNHIGKLACFACLLLLLEIPRLRSAKFSLSTQSIFLILAFAIPLIILILDPSKSPVVGSILVVPTLWLIIWARYYFYSPAKNLIPIAVIIFSLGIYHQYHCYHHKSSREHFADLQAINHMYQAIGDASYQNHVDTVRLSFDQIADYFTPPGLTVWYYEHNKKFLHVEGKFGNAIFSINPDEMMKKISESNVLILNQNNYHSASAYPFNHEINSYQPVLKKYADEHLKVLEKYHFMGNNYKVYHA